MRVSDSTNQRQALDRMLDLQQGLNKVQTQMASGKRILAPSDDPSASARVFVLEGEIARTNQFNRNGDAVERKQSHEDTILESISNVVQRAREKTVQGLNDSYNASDRAMIATEIEQYFFELTGLLNSQNETGEYIFGGLRNEAPPFVYQNEDGEDIVPFSRSDTGIVNNSFNYDGDDGVRRVQVSDTLSLEASDPGLSVFYDVSAEVKKMQVKAADTNLSQAMLAAEFSEYGFDKSVSYQAKYINTGGLAPASWEVSRIENGDVNNPIAVTAEERPLGSGNWEVNDGTESFSFNRTSAVEPANNDVFDITPTTNQSLLETVYSLVDGLRNNRLDGEVLTNLDSAMDSINQTRAKVGSRLNSVEMQRDINMDYDLFIQENLSRLRDLDMAEAITMYQQQLTVLQAVQQTYSQVQGLSLFNYM